MGKFKSFYIGGAATVFVLYLIFAYGPQNDLYSSDEIGFYELSSESSGKPYGTLDAVKKRFLQDVAGENQQTFVGSDFDKALVAYNQKLQTARYEKEADPIDMFLSTLPASYRRHYTFVHRSFSMQKGTPMSPRTILFGKEAQVLMTFNAGLDDKGQHQPGGEVIEVIRWQPEQKTWSFSEIEFDASKRAIEHKNPAKCVMCHAGTPKPLDASDADKYIGHMKPIFPQYPFWPGFYGSVNDVVGIDEPNSKDTITRNLPDTIKQVEGLTFGSTEELYRLKQLLDQAKPPSKEKTHLNYLDVVKNEMDVHLKNFRPFIDSMKKRNRYRHLIQITDSYVEKGEKIPEALRSAPYRRTFDKEYGHYLLRPNFYLTTLLTSYQAQNIAQRIFKHPQFDQIKYSFLFKKFNCGEISGDGISTKELNPSFDLFYPNQSSTDARDKQFLLSYQYNVVQSQKGGVPALPLHAWNLEGNEEIASYHYGNVYADMNEIVLWHLLAMVYGTVPVESGRDAAEKRHYEIPSATYFQKPLAEAKSFVSRMTSAQMAAVGNNLPYADTAKKFAAMPISNFCNKETGSLAAAAKEELKNLAKLKQEGKLPHQVYVLDPQLYTEDAAIKKLKFKTSMAKQACDACHTVNASRPDVVIPPFLNVDWTSKNYFENLKQPYVSIEPSLPQAKSLYHYLMAVIDEKELPIPFGQQMPYGRRPMDSEVLACEKMVIEKVRQADRAFGYAELFECGKSYPNADPNSLGCRCFKLKNAMHSLHKKFYMQ